MKFCRLIELNCLCIARIEISFTMVNGDVITRNTLIIYLLLLVVILVQIWILSDHSLTFGLSPLNCEVCYRKWWYYERSMISKIVEEVPYGLLPEVCERFLLITRDLVINNVSDVVQIAKSLSHVEFVDVS